MLGLVVGELRHLRTISTRWLQWRRICQPQRCGWETIGEV